MLLNGWSTDSKPEETAETKKEVALNNWKQKDKRKAKMAIKYRRTELIKMQIKTIFILKREQWAVVLWHFWACTVTPTHRQGSLGGDLSLKWAISSAECNICILIQGWTANEETEDQEPRNTYQGFTHSQRASTPAFHGELAGSVWRQL